LALSRSGKVRADSAADARAYSCPSQISTVKTRVELSGIWIACISAPAVSVSGSSEPARYGAYGCIFIALSIWRDIRANNAAESCADRSAEKRAVIKIADELGLS